MTRSRSSVRRIAPSPMPARSPANPTRVTRRSSAQACVAVSIAMLSATPRAVSLSPSSDSTPLIDSGSSIRMLPSSRRPMLAMPGSGDRPEVVASTSRSTVHTLARADQPAGGATSGTRSNAMAMPPPLTEARRGAGMPGCPVEGAQCAVEPARGAEVGLVAELGTGRRRAGIGVVRVGIRGRTRGPPCCRGCRRAATAQRERGTGDDEPARDAEQRRPGAELDAAAGVLGGRDVGLLSSGGVDLGRVRSARPSRRRR